MTVYELHRRLAGLETYLRGKADRNANPAVRANFAAWIEALGVVRDYFDPDDDRPHAESVADLRAAGPAGEGE